MINIGNIQTAGRDISGDKDLEPTSAKSLKCGTAFGQSMPPMEHCHTVTNLLQ